MCYVNVMEVAHDNAATVKNYITEDYVSWTPMTYGMVWLLISQYTLMVSVLYLGTKNVAKSMRKISCSAKKTEGKSWFVELSDKCEWSHTVESNIIWLCI